MEPYLIAYNAVFHILCLLALPFFSLKILTGKYRKSFAQKLGLLPQGIPASLRGCPRIWAHAVSVGEVVAISPIVTELKKAYPTSSIVISTTTETGQEMAKQEIREADACIYFPLDSLPIVKKVTSLIKPDLFITCESELWPCFVHTIKKRGAKIMLVNGRLSPGSAMRYRRLRPLFQRVLEDFDYLGMASDEDRRRLESIGGSLSKKICVTGNSKYDKLIDQTKPSYEGEMRKLLKIRKDELVFIAASTHRGEEKIVLRAYKRLRESFPQLFLIIAPRHRERGNEVKKLAEKENLCPCILRSQLRQGGRTDEKIIILDSIGELFKVYSLGTVIFCGGSLVPRGGQNILEAGAWGKVVFYGSSMEDFVDARQTIEQAGAGFTLRGEDDLVKKGLYFLENPKERERLGGLAKKAILNKAGSARVCANLASELLK